MGRDERYSMKMEKKAGIAIVMSDKINSKTKAITRNKGH